MLGAREGFNARVKQANPNVEVVHCLLHREDLAAQHLWLDLLAVMQEVVAVVNFIKSSAVNSCLFKQMCIDFESEFQHFLFYSNLRWLSRGKRWCRVALQIYEQSCRSFSFRKIIAMSFGYKMWSGCSKYTT